MRGPARAPETEGGKAGDSESDAPARPPCQCDHRHGEHHPSHKSELEYHFILHSGLK